MTGICRICGIEGEGISFTDWVKDTFTNYDELYPGTIICNDCLFWFDQRSEELQRRVGKDKPQKMQNYSHFIVAGEWLPVSKGDKRKMARILLDGNMPEMAVIAESGQKHLAFRARRNPEGQKSGWVQFEERCIWIDQEHFRMLLQWIEALYGGFTKEEIRSGRYSPRRILQYGMERWKILEDRIKPIRGTDIFQLALYLAQRSDDDRQDDGSNASQHHLEGDSERLQESLSDDNMGSVRERNPQRGLHSKSGEVYQLDLFASGGGYWEDRGGEGNGGGDSTHSR